MGFRKDISVRLTNPLVRLLARTSISPNTLTWIGFILTVAAAIIIGTGHLFTGGWAVIIAGCFDMLDGALARLAHKTTAFGAALDSTLDRLSEAALLLAIMFWYARQDAYWFVLLTGLALTASFAVSYVRARAEGLGLQLLEGFFTRADRVIVLALGLLLSQFNGILPIALGIITLLSFITAGQRLYLISQKTKNKS
jgi:CDP-diacylglycerol---glycerol-3-phosphate 3-phosphatidyltransferase